MRFCIFLLAIALTACASSPPTPRAQAAKVYLSDPGLYRISRSDLQTAGFNLSSAEPETLARLHLVHRDKELPIEIEGQGENFAIRFYAEPVYSNYSPTDVYWLYLEETAGKRIQTRRVKPETEGAPSDSFPATLKLEQDELYSSEGIGGTHWFWQALSAPATKSITVSLPLLHPNAAEVRVALAGETTGQHNVRVLVNNQLTGTAQWDGQSLYLYTANVTNMRKGENVVTLDLPDAGGTVDVILLDSVTLGYSSEFLAADDVLEFTGAQDYLLRGFQSETVSLYDISDPESVEKLDGFGLAGVTGTTALTFHDDSSGRRYAATTTAAFRKPVEIRLARPNDLRAPDQQADYLVLAPATFADALQPLLKYRSAQGLKARFVDVEQIYDAFGAGVSDPHAIRDFIQYARVNWLKPAPRFVLLVGKASYDYRDNLKGPNRNLVPTFLVPTPHLGEAASDDWFVASSETDPHPALAIGRIPAKTPEQLSTAIDKIIAYGSGPLDADWRRRAVFVTDQEDPTFDASSDQLVSGLPQAMEAKKIYLSANGGNLDSTRGEIVRQWNMGALLMTFIGHGSIDTWAAGRIMPP